MGESSVQGSRQQKVENGGNAGFDGPVPVPAEATARLPESPTLVARLRRRLPGSITLSALLGAGDDATAGDLCDPEGFWLESSTDQWTGFLRVGEFVGHAVPVVADTDSMRLVGAVTEGDYIAACRHSI